MLGLKLIHANERSPSALSQWEDKPINNKDTDELPTFRHS